MNRCSKKKKIKKKEDNKKLTSTDIPTFSSEMQICKCEKARSRYSAKQSIIFFFFLFTVQPRKAFIWKYKSERFQYFQIVRSSFHRKPKAVNKERQSREGLNDYIVYLELGRDSMTRVK